MNTYEGLMIDGVEYRAEHKMDKGVSLISIFCKDHLCGTIQIDAFRAEPKVEILTVHPAFVSIINKLAQAITDRFLAQAITDRLDRLEIKAR